MHCIASAHDLWPLCDRWRHFELGLVLNSAVTDLVLPVEVGALGVHHSGSFECDLADDTLTWSGGVYDVFGLPRGTAITRDEAISFYHEESRVALERLRSHAIRQQHGFTIDVQIRSAVGETRRTRIIAAPVCDDGRARRLHGLKLII